MDDGGTRHMNRLTELAIKEPGAFGHVAVVGN